MKFLPIHIAIVGSVVLTSFSFGKASASNPRMVTELKHNWTFNYFPSAEINKEYTNVKFDDSQWSPISIPHTWQTYETTGELHPFIKSPAESDDPYWWKGLGWYRKKIIISNEHEGKKFFLEFDGVQKHCWVFVNGDKADENLGGYNSFSIDVTGQIKCGQSNIIAIAVSNLRDDPNRIPPMTAGNFNGYGGIYRDVRLVIKDPLHIPYQGNWQHEGGTFITTPELGQNGVDSYKIGGEGKVHITTYVKNDYSQKVPATLESILLSPSGETLQTMRTTTFIDPGRIQAIEQISKPVEDFQWWSPESPTLYIVESKVFLQNQLVDQQEETFGFRWFRWNRDTNTFFLNGEPVHIQGTNRHQEYPWLGDAMPKWLHEEELRQIRYDMGMNFMRAAHYPNDPLVYNLADELGIIMVEEVPNIKPIDFCEQVQEHNARAMVRRDRNHPSILFWSLGNETNKPAAGKWVHEEDSSRIIHLRQSWPPEVDPYVTHTHEQLDMENSLRVTIRGWSDSSVKNLRPIDGMWAGTEEWQHLQMRTHGYKRRARIDEDFVHWLYADHGLDRTYKDAPIQHVNPKGWLDLYRIPKYAYHLWRANSVQEPVLFIHPHTWIEKNVGSRKDIRIDSNAEKVELFVNGKSQGIKTPCKSNFYTVLFRNVTVEKGVLEAIGHKGKEKIIHKLVMPGKPAKLRLSTENNQIYAERSEIAIIRVDILDDEENLIYNATNDLHWDLEGPASWVGPKVYKSDINKNQEHEGTMYITAPVKNLLRATPESGKIKVTVSSPGLSSDTLVIESIVPPKPSEKAVIQPKVETANKRDVKVQSNRKRYTAAPGRALIKPSDYDIDIEGDNANELRNNLRTWIKEKNPKLDTSSEEYRSLENRLVDMLKIGKGHLIQDDYNFVVEQYFR